MAWGALNAAIIVFAKLNPVIVTLATNFIGLAALFLVFQLAQVPNGSDIHALGRVQLRPAGDLVADGGADRRSSAS